MTDDRKEKLFDAVIKLAFEESVEQEMASLPGKQELDKMTPHSAAFDKRVADIIAKEGKIKKRRSKIFIGAAASFILLFGIGALINMFMLPLVSGINYELPMAVVLDAAPDAVFDESEPIRGAQTEARDFFWQEPLTIDININGQDVQIFEAFWDGGHHTAMWEQEGAQFTFSSNVDLDSFIALLESLLGE